MVYCPNCGSTNAPNSTMCSYCGYPLSDYLTEGTPLLAPIEQEQKEPVSLWQWYFCKHPRVLILVPVFLYFVLGGITSGFTAITDMIYFFQVHRWGAVAVYLIFGGILIPVVLTPAFLAFYSIKWLHSIFVEVENAWAKLGLTICLILILPWVLSIFRYLYLLVLGISEKYNYTFLPYW
jgi:hypothetical protein